jgi:hypothetical protein
MYRPRSGLRNKGSKSGNPKLSRQTPLETRYTRLRNNDARRSGFDFLGFSIGTLVYGRILTVKNPAFSFSVTSRKPSTSKRLRTHESTLAVVTHV